MKTFKEELIDVVKAVGQEIIDRAEEIVGDTSLLGRMVITVDFDPEFDMRLPSINVDKEFVCSRAYDIFVNQPTMEEI